MEITKQKQYGRILSMALDNIKNNVIKGIEKAQAAGVNCEPQKTIEVDLALDMNGIPCSERSMCSARIKTTIIL